MTLELKNLSDSLLITLANDGSLPIEVSKRMALGAQVGWAEITLLITDSKGNELHKSSTGRLGPPELEMLVTLEPQDSLDVPIKVETIQRYFRLRPGEYNIVALYWMRNYRTHENSSEVSSVKSNPIRLKISAKN